MKYLNNLLLLVLCLGVSTLGMAQGGTDCSTAATPAFGLNTASGPSTVLGTASNNCFGSGGTNAEWYAFTPANTGFFNITATNDPNLTDTRLSLYDGTCPGALNCVASDDDGGNGFTSELMAVPVTGGTTYYIEWDDRWTGNGFQWEFDYYYCTGGISNVTATDNGSGNVTLTWTGGPSAYVYGPGGFTDPTQATLGFGASGAMISGIGNGSWDFYVVDTCVVNGVSQVSLIGPSSICVGSYTGTVTAAPFTAGFEPCGGNLSDFWIQSTMDDFDWTQRTGSTSSGGTGPSGANQGNYYIYIETSGGVGQGDSAVIESEKVDMGAVPTPTLRFDYHMYGSAMGTLRCEVNDGTGWTNAWQMSGDQGDQWYTAEIDLTPYGDTVSVRFTGVDGTSFTGDAAVDNVRFEDFCPATVSAPYFESFESPIVCMEQSAMDVFDWTLDDNGTGSSGTGPSAAYDSTYYFYTETSNPIAPGDSAIIATPIIDITSLQYPELSFAYHMYGTSMGTLRVEMSNDLGATWMTVWEDSTDQGDQWYIAKVNLPAAGAGPFVKFRWTGVAGYDGTLSAPSAWRSDMAIDAISVANGVATDLALVDAMADFTTCASTGNPVALEVVNQGFTPVFDFEYGVEINGALITQTYTDTLMPTESAVLTFNNGVDLMPGTNVISVGFDGSSFGDLNPLNDFFDNDTIQVSGSADGQAYTMGWEMGDGGWIGEGDWALGAPAGAVINSAGGGASSWVTNLAGDYNHFALDFLYSPCFDFSSYVADPEVSFDIFWDIEDDWDGAWLEYTTDGGLTWAKLGGLGTGTNWYNANVTNNPIGDVWNGNGANNSGGWVTASHPVMGTAGMSSVQFRFVFFSDGAVANEGVGVDNFNVNSPCPADLGLSVVASSATNDTTGDVSAAVTASAGVAPYTFAWSDGQTTQVATGLMGNTTYSVVVTDAAGCTDSISVTPFVNSSDFISSMNGLNVFPNPTNTNANVLVSFDQTVAVEVQVLNAIGQVLNSERREGVTNAEFNFDVSNYAAGVYMVRILANNQSVTRKLVITE